MWYIFVLSVTFWTCSDSVVFFFYSILETFRQCGIFSIRFKKRYDIVTFFVFLLDFLNVPTVMNLSVFLLEVGTVPTVRYFALRVCGGGGVLLDFRKVSNVWYFYVFLINFGNDPTLS